MLALISRTFLRIESFLEFSSSYTLSSSSAWTSLICGKMLFWWQKSTHSWVWGMPPIIDPATERFFISKTSWCTECCCSVSPICTKTPLGLCRKMRLELTSLICCLPEAEDTHWGHGQQKQCWGSGQESWRRPSYFQHWLTLQSYQHQSLLQQPLCLEKWILHRQCYLGLLSINIKHTLHTL